jgi:hypothetical protein
MTDKTKLVEYLTSEIKSVGKRLAFFQRDNTDIEAIKEYTEKVEILKEIKLVVVNSK